MKLSYLSLASLTLAGALATGPVLAQTNLTMWKAGDCPPDLCIEQQLIDAFVAANPDVSIELVQQPVDNFFTSLLTTSVVGRGPDIATMWAGRYMIEFEPYMADIDQWVSADLLADANGSQFYSKNNDLNDVTYGVPIASQWYTGFYNKQIFADNGITDLPTTWAELEAVSAKLKDAGVQPIVQGTDGGSAQFQPLFEWSYLAAEFPLGEWGDLINGTMAYANDTLVSQVEHWHELYAAGYVNEDAFNYPGAVEDFKTGKAAMMLGGGSWQVSELEQALGDNLGIIVPPYSEEMQDGLIALAGGGYVIMNYSDNQETAGRFLNFVLSDEGQLIISKIDAPTRPGFPTDFAGINELIEKSSSGDYTVYPMFDNFTHPSESDALYRNLALALVGQASATDALAAVDAAHASLPDDQKALTLAFGTE